MPKKPKTRKVARSAKSGEFVTKANAKRHPNTTVTESVPVGRTIAAAPSIPASLAKRVAQGKRNRRKISSFESDLSDLINKHGVDAQTGIPDYTLAEFITRVLGV